MKIEIVAIDRVKPYDKNPRKNDPAVPAVAKSIEQFGFRKPIVVDVDGVIICGHTCYKAALQLGLVKVPVHVARDLTPEQVKAYRLADNKTSELAEWDFDLLPEELTGLQELNFDITTLGFSADDLADLLGPLPGLVDADVIPPLPAKAKTKPGDLWILGNHRLLCGDSSKADHLDRLLDGAAIHLVNTDPPYNVKVEPRSNNAIAAGMNSAEGPRKNQQLDAARRKSKPTDETMRAKDRPLANDFVSDAEFDVLLSAWFSNISRVLLPGHAFYVWGGYANIANYPAPLKVAKLNFAQAIIWVKDHPVLTRKDFMGDHEWCFYGWREGAGHRFFGEHNEPDVWHVQQVTGGQCAIGKGVCLEGPNGSRIEVGPPVRDKLRTVSVGDEGVILVGPNPASDVWRVRKVPGQKMVHLTEKPVERAMRAMKLSSLAGENVLDLFGGSGSTLIAAEQLGRNAFLMELDPLYCDVIVARYEQFTGKKAERVAAAPAKAKPKKVKAAAGR